MLGGGTFLTQNKVLPGTYINYISMARAGVTLSDRGIVACALELDFGVENKIIEIDSIDVMKECYKLFGRDYTDDKMINLRELFKGAKKALIYRINGGTAKATATHENLTITAKYSGERGNDIKIIIQKNIDDISKYEVTTMIGSKKMDMQLVGSIEELKENDAVSFKGTGVPTISAGINLSGGASKVVTKEDYTNFLNIVESEYFHTLCYAGTDDSLKNLFVEFTKRMRDDMGVKFQTVLYKNSDADYEGIISAENKVLGDNVKECDLVYWVAGKEAGCDINKSLSNTTYNGELQIEANFKQGELIKGLNAGKFIMHKVEDKINILDDINTFTSFTLDKNEDFAMNQVIRVLDSDAFETAKIFNKRYLGKVQNNKAGRIAFWNEMVTLGNEMQKINALEDFDSKDVTVVIGADKKSVGVTKYIKPVTAMTKLYVTTVVE